ncbi:MAG: type II and III secretion system protein [Firmicutes bacterium]|nr:type II and III secretion system protein [Bacillota bacterium]
MHKRKCPLLCLGLLLVLMVSISNNTLARTEDELSATGPSVTILLFDTDLREALGEISMQTGINIIPDETVSGRVTADLVDVPLEKALRMILFTGGFTYHKIDDFYFVGLPDPKNATFGNLVETEIIRLQNTECQAILDQIPVFLTPYVRGAPIGNVLTVSAPLRELARIKQLIEALDVPEKMVEIKVLVTEVSSEAVKELGNTLLDFSIQKGQTVNKDWTFDFNLFTDGLLTFETNIWGTLLTKLKLLEEKQEAKIHADPRVMVAHGQTADLFVGDRRILLISPEGAEPSRTERIEVGVTLKVTPTIIGDDVILNIAPEVSHFVDEARTDLIVKRNAVSTTVRLAHGQTAVLAGMTMQDFSDLSRRVPVLGDIPLIRWLFRSDVKRTSDKEVLIFVTPVIQ